MKPWRLQTRLLLLVLVPVTLLVFALGFATVMARFHSEESVQDERARILLAKYLFAFDQLRETTPTNLQGLAVAALEETGLRSLSLLDGQGRTLLHSGPLSRPLNAGQTLRLDDETRRYFTRDSWIYVQRLRNPVPDEHNRLHTAWVALEFGTQDMTLRKYEALLMVGLLCLGVLTLVAALLVQRVHRWLAPVAEMTETLQQVDSQHLDRRLYTDASGDLQDLEAAINALLERLAADTEELQSSMTQANEDLRETMEAMEVQNIELTLARKEAVEGNRIKSEFLANISHELRTPLNGILGFAKLLMKTQMSPRQVDYVKTILKSSDSLLAIINDVLDLSKIEAGKLVLDHTPLDIEEVIFDVLGMLAPQAEEKNLEQVAFIYDDVPRHLMGDPLRLKQIITNLVNNAIKFTPEGEIIVRCMLENLTERHVTLRITVTDTGIGLSDATRADLFRAFSQGDPSTSRKFGGTGLGLVISRHLVEQMHGEISVDSRDGHGSTFWFTLRAELDNYTHSGFYGDVLRGRRFLIAEPHASSRQYLANTLDHWGASSLAVDSLEALYAALRDGASPDALLLNLDLLDSRNVMSNLQLGELRRLVSGPILLIARSSDASQEQASHLDPQMAILSKPLAPRELYTRLSQMFSALPLALPEAVPVLPPPTGPLLKVLAVDDNPANLKLVCALLGDLHVEVTPAADGYQAIRLCQENRFDIAFMDIQMPGLSGLETTEAIRQHEQETGRKRLPVVALTAHAMANEREALLRAGMDDYLTKPVLESQLMHMLRKWTGTTLANAGAASASAPGAGQEAPAGDSVVNWTESLRLAAGKRELARDMLAMLVNSLEQERRKIRDAFEADDIEALLAHVHYLHGATRYCGVPALRDAAQVLETGIKSRVGVYQQQLAEGGVGEKPGTDCCRVEVERLLERIDQLIVWRESNPLP